MRWEKVIVKGPDLNQNGNDYLLARDVVKGTLANKCWERLQGVQSGHLQVFKQAYCCYAEPYDRMQFLSYLKLWRATIQCEYKNRADAEGLSFIVWHNRDFNLVPKMERS